MKIVAVSGGFDPVHIGHIRFFEQARSLGDQLVVIINNDNWIMSKKGYVFMLEGERLEIIRSLQYVDMAILSTHAIADLDTSVTRELNSIRPHIFCNGGDRTIDNSNSTPEDDICNRLGIKMIFGVGGSKIQSSSKLVQNQIQIKSF